MKKIALALLVFVSASAYADLTVVNVEQLTAPELNAIMQSHCPDMAVEFSAQTILPVSFFLKGDLVQLIDENTSQIEIKQTFYARYIQEALFLSSDLKNWKPWLEFITGTASTTLSIQDNQCSIQIGAEVSPRT